MTRNTQNRLCHVDLSGLRMINLWLNVDYCKTACAFDVRPPMNDAPERSQSIEMSFDWFNSFLINCSMHGYCFRCGLCFLINALLKGMSFVNSVHYILCIQSCFGDKAYNVETKCNTKLPKTLKTRKIGKTGQMLHQSTACTLYNS